MSNPVSTSRVAVAVPTWTLDLGADERTSLRHLREYLDQYDTYLVTPAEGTLEGLRTLRFDRRFFASHRAHQRLLLSSAFYEAFSEYEFLLVHHLDALVFGDELADWCERGYDYVGAPWTRREADGRLHFAGAGNGGLSLRSVASCLRVLRSRSPLDRLRSGAALARALAHRAVARVPKGPQAMRAALATPYLFEDKFWAIEAPRLDPSFRVAPAGVAVSFAFETEPRFCFEQNGRRLPFGCHKWWVHDPAFWEPHLLGDPARAERS